MKTNTITRLLLLLVLCLGLCLPGLADTQDAPTIVYTQATDGLVVHKSEMFPNTYVPVAVHLADVQGLQSATLSGAYASATGRFPAGTQSADARLLFFAWYYPTDDYTFVATATNQAGVKTTRTITVHLVP